MPSITSLIDTLERRGLVTRERSSVDRRLVDVSITEAGKHLAAEAQQKVNEQEQGFAAGLGDEELAELTRLLSKFDRAVRNEAAPAHASGSTGTASGGRTDGVPRPR